jgi:[ribosomal protein S5]-alanine N-acetyltransferase
MISPLDLSSFFEHHPTLETERLLLREVTIADATDLHAYFGDPETVVYIPHLALKTIAETEEILSRSAKYLSERDSIRFAIERKSDGKVMGIFDLHSISPENHRMEIGYGLAKEYWGFGYMTEAVREVIRFAFDEMSMHRIEAECQPDNIRSIRVAEKWGMTLEATRTENEINKGRFVSNHVYAIVRN